MLWDQSLWYSECTIFGRLGDDLGNGEYVCYILLVALGDLYLFIRSMPNNTHTLPCRDHSVVLQFYCNIFRSRWILIIVNVSVHNNSVKVGGSCSRSGWGVQNSRGGGNSPPLNPDTVSEFTPPSLNVTFNGWLKMIPAFPLRCLKKTSGPPFTETAAVRFKMNDCPETPRLSPPE